MKTNKFIGSCDETVYQGKLEIQRPISDIKQVIIETQSYQELVDGIASKIKQQHKHIWDSTKFLVGGEPTPKSNTTLKEYLESLIDVLDNNIKEESKAKSYSENEECLVELLCMTLVLYSEYQPKQKPPNKCQTVQ